MNMHLLGWDIDSWAQAIALKGIESISYKSAAKLKRDYINQYGCAPGGVDFKGIDIPKDYDKAYELFSLSRWAAA